MKFERCRFKKYYVVYGVAGKNVFVFSQKTGQRDYTFEAWFAGWRKKEIRPLFPYGRFLDGSIDYGHKDIQSQVKRIFQK